MPDNNKTARREPENGSHAKQIRQLKEKMAEATKIEDWLRMEQQLARLISQGEPDE